MFKRTIRLGTLAAFVSPLLDVRPLNQRHHRWRLYLVKKNRMKPYRETINLVRQPLNRRSVTNLQAKPQTGRSR
jgi:hypothetical protein